MESQIEESHHPHMPRHITDKHAQDRESLRRC